MKLFTSLTLAILICFGAVAISVQSKTSQAKDLEGSRRVDNTNEEKTKDTQESGSASDDVQTGHAVTRAASITARPEPDYSREGKHNNVEGTVRLKLILRSDGKVDEHIQVLKSLPDGLTEEAIKAAKKIKFKPAQKDGRKVSQYVIIEYNFNLY